MQIKKTFWQPVVFGVIFGTLAGITMTTGLSFLVPGINSTAIGLYGILSLIAAALGGPLSGAIAPIFWIGIVALFGSPEMKEIITIPPVFWSNLFSQAVTLILVGFAYRLIFERMKMPALLLPWAIIVIAYYALSNPISIIPQYYLLEGPASEIASAILEAYTTYVPQIIFDIVFTSLVFIALPERYRRPLWYQPKQTIST